MQLNLVDWCSSQWFSLVHSNNLVYNACWEDPRIDRQALKLGPNDSLLAITSAGCNVLDYALLGPKHIYSVDVNPRQNALLELKMAGIRTLDYESFFEIFGKGRHPDFLNLYKSQLRPQLSTVAAKHWDSQVGYFTGDSSRSGFYFRGAAGTIANWVNHYIDLNRLREPIEAIFNADTIAEQSYIYRTVLRKAFWNDVIRWVLQWDLPFAFLGVPRTQRQQVEEQYRGGMRQFIEDRLETVFARLSLKDNYFWWLYLSGEYLPDRCPEYLKRENFEALRSGLVDRITVHTSSLVGFLNVFEGKISRFVLLDHMDWLRGSLRHVLEEEWQLFLDVAAPDTRMLWRSAALRSDFVDTVEVEVGGKRYRVGEMLNYQTDLADRLHALDRVNTYGSFAIAEVAGQLQ